MAIAEPDYRSRPELRATRVTHTSTHTAIEALSEDFKSPCRPGQRDTKLRRHVPW
jgi:hypothetical protein